MPAPYPKELRDRVIKARQRGDATIAEIALRFDIGSQTVVRWTGLFRRTGSVAPAAMGGARRGFKVDDEGAVIVREILDCHLDATLPEVCALYEEIRGVRVSPQTMSCTVHRLGYTRKRGSFAGWRPVGRRP